jgi:DNA-binding NtrC family response regulator
MPHAVIVEDDASSRVALSQLVEKEGFSVESAASLLQARALFERRLPHVVLSDLVLPDGHGIDLLRELHERHPDLPVVLITGHATVETAVAALRHGAVDYLTKPIEIPHLKSVLANVMRTLRMQEEIERLRGELRDLGRFGHMVGSSPAMHEVYDLLRRVAPTGATVLLTGDSGTGKELAARTVHDLSKRRDGPFIPVNCGAMAANLIESELFGHEKGSFTGATGRHKGHFERAAGGTLFLDEITEMPPELQAKLLRVLETGTVMRIGGEAELPVDVRVVAATNRRPEEAVAEGKLREDLLYRLKVFHVHLPALRERGHDVELLTEHFLRTFNDQEGTSKWIAPTAMKVLRAYHWPGNVRELKNVIHRAFILADEDIGTDCLSLEPPSDDLATGPHLQVRIGTSIPEVERRLLLATLEHVGGNKVKAAEILRVSLKTLYNRLNQYKALRG